MGPFYSGAMPAALATARIQTVGAFYNRDWKSWAHWIAGLCLQPWPQKALKSWRILQWRIEIVGTFYSRAMPAAKATARNETVGVCSSGHLKSWAHFIAGLGLQPWPRTEIVGAFYNGVWKSWAHFIAGLCLQPWPQKELKSWAHFTMGFENRRPIL